MGARTKRVICSSQVFRHAYGAPKIVCFTSVKNVNSSTMRSETASLSHGMSDYCDSYEWTDMHILKYDKEMTCRLIINEMEGCIILMRDQINK